MQVSMMSKKELKETISKMRKIGLKAAQTQKSARAFLISTGVYTKKGNLKARYKKQKV